MQFPIELPAAQTARPRRSRALAANDEWLAHVIAGADHVRLFECGRQKLIGVNADPPHVATFATVDSLAEGGR